jgi:hypothetical protein
MERALLLDAGGVPLLPHPEDVREALPWMHLDDDVVDRAHFAGIAAVDQARPAPYVDVLPFYVPAYLEALGVEETHFGEGW